MTSRILPPDTRSTATVYATLRRALIEYVDPVSRRALADYCDGHTPVYVVRPPDNPPSYPYITLRLTLTSDTNTNSYRQTGNLEVMVVGKPASQAERVEDLADLCDAVLAGYTQTGSGVVLGRGRVRQTVPRFDDPADRDVVAVMLDYSIILWGRVTTDRAPNTFVPPTPPAVVIIGAGDVRVEVGADAVGQIIAPTLGDGATAAEVFASAVATLRVLATGVAGAEAASDAVAALRLYGVGSAGAEASGAASGVLRVPATGAASAEVASDATGVLRLLGTATGSAEVAGAATGAVRMLGTGDASAEVAGAATGAVRVAGTATGAAEAFADAEGTVVSLADALLLEDGDDLLLESGDRILLEV